MIRLGVCVEGPTERDFFKNVISPHLQEFNIYCYRPLSLNGGISLNSVKKALRPLLRSYDVVTTMFDLYGFGGMSLDKTATDIENEILSSSDDLGQLIPYVQQYEFETLLFSNPQIVATELNDNTIAQQMQTILHQCGHPENINNGYDTCPSRRLKSIHAAYDKHLFGPLIAEEIGLVQLRSACPRFNNWIENLNK